MNEDSWLAKNTAAAFVAAMSSRSNPATAASAPTRTEHARPSCDDGVMWEVEPWPIRNKLRNPIRSHVKCKSPGTALDLRPGVKLKPGRAVRTAYHPPRHLPDNDHSSRCFPEENTTLALFHTSIIFLHGSTRFLVILARASATANSRNSETTVSRENPSLRSKKRTPPFTVIRYLYNPSPTGFRSSTIRTNCKSPTVPVASSSALSSILSTCTRASRISSTAISTNLISLRIAT